jgi:hypothetical protein
MLQNAELRVLGEQSPRLEHRHSGIWPRQATPSARAGRSRYGVTFMPEFIEAVAALAD